MITEFFSFLNIDWENIKTFSNSAFTTAIIGSLTGAYFGAYGAQLIAEKTKKREELLKELRNTNAAIAISFGICDSLLSLKEQHVKLLKEKFETHKQELQDFHNQRNAGKIGKDVAFNFQADFQTLSILPLPIDILQKQIFEKLSLGGRPLRLVTTIGQTAHGLSTSLEKRNQLIEFYKTRLEKTPEELPRLYFGLPYNGGHINQDYPDSINAIYRQTDDGIFFSKLLCVDLIEHGEQLEKNFKKKFGKGAPKVSKVDFAKAELAGLMPNPNGYADWMSGFAKHPSQKFLFFRLFPFLDREKK